MIIEHLDGTHNRYYSNYAAYEAIGKCRKDGEH